MEEIIKDIIIKPDISTVQYDLNGDRNEDSEKMLTKVYSGYDDERLMKAIDLLKEYYYDIHKIKEVKQ